MQTGCAEDGGEEFCASVQATAAKKSAMPNSRKARLVFAGMCQTWRPMRPKRPKDERDEKGTAGKAELNRLRQSREGDGQVTSAIPRVMPMKNGTKCFVEFLKRVADDGGGFVEVAEFESQPVGQTFGAEAFTSELTLAA